MAKMSLGPVIGKVTDTSARVLIEVDADVQVSCATTSPNGSATQTIPCTKNRAAVFHLNNLSPETEYELTFQGVSAGYPKSRIRTFATNLDKLNVAAISCNYLGRREEASGPGNP